DHLKMEMEMEIPSVKASANSDIIFFFTSAQDGNKLLDDERLSLADDLKKAHDQNQNKCGLVYVSDTCPSSPLKSEKLVAVTPMNKARKVTFAKTSTTSDNNTQIQVDVHQTQTHLGEGSGGGDMEVGEGGKGWTGGGDWLREGVSPSLYVPPSKKDYEISFQPLFVEYFYPPPRVVSTDLVAVAAPRAVDPASSPSLTTLDQDVPSASTSPRN
ncbi:hypothetical protein Tco_1007948, partial [Tanacetum coccineum]